MADRRTNPGQRDAGLYLSARDLGPKRSRGADRRRRPVAKPAAGTGGASMMHNVVFLFDVDNTLLDNDRVQADLDVHIGIEHGTAARNRFWEIFETLRS